MSISNLPRDMISHIVSFMNYEDRNRFSMTCKEYYVYKVPMDLYEFETSMCFAIVERRLLELGIPRERIVALFAPRVVILPPKPPLWIYSSIEQVCVTRAWMTPSELSIVLLYAPYLKPEKTQPDAPCKRPVYED